MGKYKIGQKVKVSPKICLRGYLSNSGKKNSVWRVGTEQASLKGTVLTIKNIDHEGDYLVYENDFQWCDEMLVDENSKEVDDLVRYMVYGDGCDNKSLLVENETALKQMLDDASKNEFWKGRIIGYKLTPLYEAERVTKLKVFKSTKIKKVK